MSFQQAPSGPPFIHTPESLLYAVAHVFVPLNPFKGTDPSVKDDISLARAVCSTARAYGSRIDETCEPQWHCITRTLDNLQASVQSEGIDRDCVISQLHEMQTGDLLAFFVRFSIIQSPDNHKSIRSPNFGILLTKRETCMMFQTLDLSAYSEPPCSLPEFAVEVPNHVFHDADFQLNFADFLSHRGGFDSDRSAQFLFSLQNDILRSVGHTVYVPPITKQFRSRDRTFALSYWHRSPLWLFIRVVIQMSVGRCPLGRGLYKAFLLFFMCTLASDANISTLYMDLLHPITCKIQCRLRKLGSSIPGWLSQMTLSTLEQLSARSSSFRNLSQDELERDTRLSLTCSHDYIQNALANHNHEPSPTPFVPRNLWRGSIHDFLNSNKIFSEAAAAGRSVKLVSYDVEKAVEEDIDDWIANVINVDEACSQLEILMGEYLRSRYFDAEDDATDYSIMLLTGIELFVALDKLIVKKIPILANYSPEVPAAALESLVAHNQTSFHRISRAYQYLLARQSQSRLGWSVLFDEDSLSVCYYDQSSHLQRLKAQIEQDARLPLPSLPLYAKVIVFELQCPLCIRIWRSAAARMWYYFSSRGRFSRVEKPEKNPLFRASILQQYYADGGHYEYPPYIQLTYSGGSQNSSTLRYTITHGNIFFMWEENKDPERWIDWWRFLKGFNPAWQKNDTSRTPNGVLANQIECPASFSLDEYLAYGELRSGGSLQWFNILHGIRRKSLNLRRMDVQNLLFCALFQVGPMDPDKATWLWHEELQDSSFCIVFLHELENLFADIGAQVIDRTMMHTISLLLTRVLASSPCDQILHQAITLLRKVRRKMLDWVRELSYNLGKEPMNEERVNLLWDMSEACLGTFDVDSATLAKSFQSEEDISAALFCTLLTDGLGSPYGSYSHRHRLSFTFKTVLSNAALSEPTDRGIDLAVSMFFPSHKPDAARWKTLDHPNDHWLTCRASCQETIEKPSKTVHLNLLDGELRLDGQPIGRLFQRIRDVSEFKGISLDVGLFVLPDLSNQGMMPKQKMHFFLRDNSQLAVQLICNDSKDIFEWVPSHILLHDLPPPLLGRHIHWLSLSRGIIEIRPLEQLLNPSPEDWRIDCTSGQYRAYKGSESLVDIRSLTWAVVSRCFKSLNVFWESIPPQNNRSLVSQANNLVMTTFPIETQSTSILRLTVTLPYHGLSFFINEQGELESRDFKNMVIESNPQVDTLSDIEHLFVLQQKAYILEGLIARRILVPNAIPTTLSDSDGLVRFIRYDEAQESTYRVYDVDTELRCLIGNGSLGSMRQLAYMHAATSRDSPDPFTGKTGLQSAVSLLRSGGCQSIAKFKSLHEDRKDLMWVSTHPEVDTVYREIQERYYWKRKTQTSRVDESTATLGQTNVTPRVPPPLFLPGTSSSQKKAFTERTSSEITLLQLFSNRPAPAALLPPRCNLPRLSHKSSLHDLSELNRLFPSLELNKPTCSEFFLQKYIARLGASALHVREESHVTFSLAEELDRFDTLKGHYLRCRAKYFDALTTLNESLCQSTILHEQVASQSGQWPPITGDTLLRCIASTSTQTLPGQWKKCLISLALLRLDLQRARRLLRFALDGLEEEFSKELENEGCMGWDPEDYPDWLLIQIQGNFLIRRNQAEIAKEMMSPKLGQNTVMQVNMGEGKSSVIIPIAAAILANGKQLVRVIVPKSLTVQMFDLLVARLGGLVNRPIYHLPFSRTPEYSQEGQVISLQIDDMHKLMMQCMEEHGILLVQPEHVVSLKQKCIESAVHNGMPVSILTSKVPKAVYQHIRASLSLKLLPEDSFVGSILRRLGRSANHLPKEAIARRYDEGNGDDLSSSDSALSWMNLEKWMKSHVRDMLDESDEILHSRFQLIYTIGLEQHMEGYPDRWTIMQYVLRFAKDCCNELARNYPGFFPIESGPPGSFPRIGSVSGSDIGRRLKQLVIEFVMAGRIPNLDFCDLSQELQDAISNFISEEGIFPDTAKRVEEYAKYSDQACTWTALLLLRGLLASNILVFALLERRWRVDYGLVFQESYSGRRPTMLAVPYRAKDTPAPNTQFGHPDITIILTCLSYYYSGLSEEQLRTSFQILLDQDDPHAEYAIWVKDYSDGMLPESLQTLGEMNLRSSEQWDEVIYPLFSRNQAAIDLYLSHVVFPREAKEFPSKLSVSSWDLVGKRGKVITGFSGTDDGRWLLPMSICQRDLDHQRGTNAKVLAYLLRPQNDFYISSANEHGERWTTLEFLQTITRLQPEIRVLLDVGAQILDTSNRRVAEAWLDIIRDAAGAIYFDEEDEMMVLLRNGKSVSMLSSSLSQQLERCVVYLDHAHTRGTDIKLPVGSRAAVTLGPRLTKDRLLQGCMRMRKLGHGHSVMFFAPPEVDRSIRTLKKDLNSHITAADILCWAIHETLTDIQQRAPHWAQQGMDYRSKEDAWSRFCSKEIKSKQLSDVWLRPAARSLEDFYAPRETEQETRGLSALDSDIQQRCKDLGVMGMPLSSVQVEEQEREVNREREHEREEELPPKAEPAEHFLHLDVVNFVKTGVIPALYSSSAFRPIFTTIEKSSAATREADVWSPFILSTADFCETIKPESTKGTIDQYLRPVQWVLSSQRDHRVLVLISPFEVNHLLPEIRASEHVHLHLYAPRKSQRMKPIDDLTFYVIPPLPSDWTPPWALIDQLNVFAGQLYLDDYDSYLRLCRFLGVPTDESENATSLRRSIRTNLFGHHEESESKFSLSPLPFVMALLAIRNRGKPFSHTHMGKILYGQILKRNDFGGSKQSVVPQHSEVTLDEESSPASPMNVDSLDGPEPSVSRLSSHKRKLEMVAVSDDESSLHPKRLRSDR